MSRISRMLRKVVSSVRRPVSQFESCQSEGLELDALDNVVFLDNRFPNCIDQVFHYFTSGFLQRTNTFLIFKYYPTNFDIIQAVCKTRGVHWFCYADNRFIPKLDDKLILYPFNSASNARVVENRACYHVLLMHGESNKVACVKPLARLYDHVLVAGDIACRRLVEHGIMSQDDIRRGRAIKLGETVIGDFEQIKRADLDSDNPVLGYFPTWEGGNDEENLSSLSHAESAILTALEFLGSRHVVMHFHPHTAERVFDYKNYAYLLIQALLNRDVKVSYLILNRPTQFETLLKANFKDIEWPEAVSPISISAALVDVSALEAVLDAKLIPNVVILNTNKLIAAPEIYWDMKPLQQVLGLNSGLEGAVFNMDIGKAKIYRKALIGYTEPALESMCHADRLDWLNEYVRRN